MARDITLRAHLTGLVGDETYELWLRHETDAWNLRLSGDVSPDGGGHQDFVLAALADDANYTAQLRLTRAGRYRSGYLSGDPSAWPSGSRVTFVPGALVGAVAPTLNSAVWSRTSSTATRMTLNISPAYTNKDLTIFRDGVAVGTVAQPFGGAVTFIDNDPPSGSHDYTVRHSSGFLYGAISNTITKWAGPPAPTGYAQSGSLTGFYTYDIIWDGSLFTRIQDDYLCSGNFTNKSISSSGAATIPMQKDSSMAANGNAHITFQGRIRHEIVSFGVSDFSDWVVIPLEADIAPDETAHNSCP